MIADDEKCTRCYARSECIRRDFSKAARERVFFKPIPLGPEVVRLSPTRAEDTEECEALRLSVRERKKKRTKPPYLFDMTEKAEEAHGS